jgi:hypothetical protein
MIDPEVVGHCSFPFPHGMGRTGSQRTCVATEQEANAGCNRLSAEAIQPAQSMDCLGCQSRSSNHDHLEGQRGQFGKMSVFGFLGRNYLLVA